MPDVTSQLMEAVLGGMIEGILAINADTEVTLYNRAAARVFGLPPVASKGARPRLIEVTRDPDINEAYRTALATREPIVRRVEVLRGEARAFELHVNPIGARTLDASASGAAGVFFDITELERLERVRRDFFANLSHELRTPLTAILAYIETLLDGGIDDPANRVRFLEIVQKNALRMQTLVRDIADLSTIESGGVSLRVEPHDLHAVVDEVLSLCSGRAEAAGVVLENRVRRGFTVRADRPRLEQILTNLVDNGVKFNARGGKVEVSAEHPQEGGSLIHVRDTGSGIAPADVPRVFERFYRADRSRSREVGGSGLGLAIVKHLARAHGGAVCVASDLGRGSAFTVALP